MTHRYIKAQVQQPVGSKDTVVTNGRTDGCCQCFTFPANAVGNNGSISKQPSFPLQDKQTETEPLRCEDDAEDDRI